MTAGEGCSATQATRGLCAYNPAAGNKPMYQQINWEDTSGSRPWIKYGEFTGRTEALQTAESGGAPGSPIVAPKYIIEQTNLPTSIPFDGGKRQLSTTSAYRVYALGYGSTKATQVLLEAVIVKPLLAKACETGAPL